MLNLIGLHPCQDLWDATYITHPQEPVLPIKILAEGSHSIATLNRESVLCNYYLPTPSLGVKRAISKGMVVVYMYS